MKRRILFISPGEDVPGAAEELAELEKHHAVTPVQGDVNLHRLVVLVNSRNYDVLWFASHGDANGIRLSEEYLDADDVVRLVRAACADLIFLNSCSTDFMASRLRRSNAYILAGQNPQLDGTGASIMGMYLGKYLYDYPALPCFSDGINQAIQALNGGSDDYIYIPRHYVLNSQLWYTIIAAISIAVFLALMIMGLT